MILCQYQMVNCGLSSKASTDEDMSSDTELSKGRVTALLSSNAVFHLIVGWRLGRALKSGLLVMCPYRCR